MVNLIDIERQDQLVLEVLLEEYGKAQRCQVTWVRKSNPKGLKITKVDKENNLIEVKGSVPGANTNVLIVLKENYAS